MKKHILFILSVIIFSVSFISCSSDDDTEVMGDFNANFYIENEKQEIEELLSDIYYSTKSKEMRVTIYGANDKQRLELFSASFENIDFYSLKVGDDLIQKANEASYILNTNERTYSMAKNPYYTDFQGYIGKAVIKTLDSSKLYIEIDFQNTIVVSDAISPIEQKVKGSIGTTITIRD